MAQDPDLAGGQVDPVAVGGDLDDLDPLVGQALADRPRSRLVREARALAQVASVRP